MKESGTKRDLQSARSDVALIKLLATFLKVAYAYPGTNPRVVDAGERVLDLIRQQTQVGVALIIGIRERQVFVSDRRVPVSGPAVEWMAECFERAPITGIRFNASARIDSLLELGRTLQRAGGSDKPLAELWRDQPGVLPLLEQKSPDLDAVSLPSSIHAAALAGFSDDRVSAHPTDMVRLLAADPLVHHEYSRIAELVTQESLDGGAPELVDLLTPIVRHLPESARKDADAASQVSLGILEVVHSQLSDLLVEQPFLDSDELKSAAVRLAEQRIARCLNNDTAIHQKDARPTGRPTDRRITNSPGELSVEVAQLPRSQIELTIADPKLAPELFGLCFHLLQTIPNWTPPADRPSLRKLLNSEKKDTSAYARIIDSHFGAQLSATDDSRVVRFLRGQGLTQLVATRVELTAQQVIQTFPTQFLALIDSLDQKQPNSLAAFRKVVNAIDQTDMRSAILVMLEESLLTPARLDSIFATGGREAAIIGEVLADQGVQWARNRVIKFLRRQSLPPAEDAAMRIVRPYSALTSGYLGDLCRCVATGRGDSKLHGYTAYLLRQFVRDNSVRPETIEQRIYAIGSLSHIGNPENEQFLAQLSRAGRLTQPTKEARSVRLAATESLQRIQARKERPK